MDQNNLFSQAFSSAKYINIETYRRSGEGVKTPVWFVESSGLLFFLTRADSGKVKRLHHNSSVKVAPCKVNGEITGDWYDANVVQVESPDSMQAINTLFAQKYGTALRISMAFSKLQKKKSIFFKVSPPEK